VVVKLGVTEAGIAEARRKSAITEQLEVIFGDEIESVVVNDI